MIDTKLFGCHHSKCVESIFIFIVVVVICGMNLATILHANRSDPGKVFRVGNAGKAFFSRVN